MVWLREVHLKGRKDDPMRDWNNIQTTTFNHFTWINRSYKLMYLEYLDWLKKIFSI